VVIGGQDVEDILLVRRVCHDVLHSGCIAATGNCAISYPNAGTPSMNLKGKISDQRSCLST
jgi:hypothetical protein